MSSFPSHPTSPKSSCFHRNHPNYFLEGRHSEFPSHRYYQKSIKAGDSISKLKKGDCLSTAFFSCWYSDSLGSSASHLKGCDQRTVPSPTVPQVDTEGFGGLHIKDLTSKGWWSTSRWSMARFSETWSEVLSPSQIQYWPPGCGSVRWDLSGAGVLQSFALLLIVRSRRSPLGRRDQCQEPWAATPLQLGAV